MSKVSPVPYCILFEMLFQGNHESKDGRKIIWEFGRIKRLVEHFFKKFKTKVITSIIQISSRVAVCQLERI